ncbi:MAG TPA: hypothetical protein VGB08_07115 [Allosphingosinicella sp.]
MLWLGAAAPARAAWLRAESDNFIVYSEGGENRLRQQVRVLEDYAALLRRLSGAAAAASPSKLSVYLVSGTGDLRRVSARIGSNVGGFYAARPTGIAAFVDTAADFDSNEVLFHEYAHHFMMQHYDHAYPPWYVEGFAEYMMTARFTERHVEFAQASPMRASWLGNTAEWLPMERVLFESGGIESDQGRARYYAQSWALTHYLMRDPARVAKLRAYIAALNRGEEPRQAFRTSFGMSPSELQRAVQSYVFGSLTYLRMDRASIAQAPRVEIVRLPPSADDLLLLQASIMLGGQEPEALLARVRRAAAQHEDPFARRVLAEAETFYGDPAVSERLLGELIATNPGDAELLYLRGMRDLLAGEREEAQRASHYRRARVWFARAHRINSNHFQTLYRYAQTFSAESGFLSDNNAEVLLLAHNLAPQVSEIRMNAATLLLERREYDLAETLLVPLASTAHEGGFSAAARELLARARARDTSGVAPAFDAPAGEDDPRARRGGEMQ